MIADLVQNSDATPSNYTTGLNDLEGAVEKPSQWLQDVIGAPREEGHVDVNGCPIHFFRWGNPQKPSLVMLHGFLAHARCFAFIAPFLANDYDVIAYDMSGMGDSGTRDDYSDKHRIEELHGLCEQLNLFEGGQKPTLIAHSYGGRVATATIRAYPDAFSGVIICDLMIIRPEILKANPERFSPPGNRTTERPHRVYPDLASAKQRFVLAPPQKVERPELFDFMAYHSLKRVQGGWQWKFDPKVYRMSENAMQEWIQTGSNVVKTPGRKAIIYGRESVLFTPDSANYVQELIQELEAQPIPTIEIPYARHHLMLDQPIAFVSAIRSILSCWQSENA